MSDATILAILSPELARPLLIVGRRFCRSQSCLVVYYGDSAVIEKSHVPLRVGVKETSDPIPLCYCLGFARADVRRELRESGNCTIPDRITAEIRAGRCACESRNPSGACCLGEVKTAIREELALLHRD